MNVVVIHLFVVFPNRKLHSTYPTLSPYLTMNTALILMFGKGNSTILYHIFTLPDTDCGYCYRMALNNLISGVGCKGQITYGQRCALHAGETVYPDAIPPCAMKLIPLRNLTHKLLLFHFHYG